MPTGLRLDVCGRPMLKSAKCMQILMPLLPPDDHVQTDPFRLPGRRNQVPGIADPRLREVTFDAEILRKAAPWPASGRIHESHAALRETSRVPRPPSHPDDLRRGAVDGKEQCGSQRRQQKLRPRHGRDLRKIGINLQARRGRKNQCLGNAHGGGNRP